MSKGLKINRDNLSFLQVRCSNCKKIFFSGLLGLDKRCDKDVRSSAVELVTTNREMIVVETFDTEDVLRVCTCAEVGE